MKGMMSFLERAGLITPESAELADSEGTVTADEPATPGPALAVEVQAGGTPLDLAEIYANEGVPPSLYPAERLLRLLDGLRAMDEPIRRTAINAMDAADESWTIADPIADADAKIKALAAHAQRLELSLQQLEQETRARVEALRTRSEQSVSAIRKQIADLEELAGRELDRAASEIAGIEGTLDTAKAQTSSELDEISKASAQLQNLAAQFGTAGTPVKG